MDDVYLNGMQKQKASMDFYSDFSGAETDDSKLLEQRMGLFHIIIL